MMGSVFAENVDTTKVYSIDSVSVVCGWWSSGAGMQYMEYGILRMFSWLFSYLETFYQKWH